MYVATLCFALHFIKWLFAISAAPEPPQNVAVVDVTEMSVTLSWSIPEANNAPILGYRISYYLPLFTGEEITFGQEVIVNVTGLETQETVMMLHPFVNYTFTVIAFNEIGDSEKSDPVSVLTNEAGWLVLSSVIIHLAVMVIKVIMYVFIFVSFLNT